VTRGGGRSLGVCMVTFAMPPEHSGAAKQALTLASHLVTLGVRVFFVTMQSSKAGIDGNRVDGFRVLRVMKENALQKALAPIRVFMVLYRERSSFEVIHVHGPGYLSTVAVLFGWCFRKPVVVKMTLFSVDDALSVKARRYGRITFACFSRASRIIAITNSFYQSCIEAGIPRRRLALIPNGVDTDVFRPVPADTKRDLRRKLGLPLDATLLVYAGIICREKGIDFLLDVVAMLGSARRDITLVLLGPVESWLKKEERIYALAQLDRVQSEELKGLVHYPGSVGNVQEYFQAADIFTSASMKEGFPNVLLEAMASGLPPVVLEVPDVHVNVLRDNVDSLVVRVRDRQTFAARVMELVEDVDLRRRLAAAALEKARSGFAMKKVTSDYLALYSSLVA